MTGEECFLILCSGYAFFTFLCVCYLFFDVKKRGRGKKKWGLGSFHYVPHY